MYVRWKFLNAGVCVFVVVAFVVVAPRSPGPKVSAAVPRAAIPKAACTVAGVMDMVCCFEWYGASQRPAWWASSVVARLVRCREVLRGGSSVGTRRATRRERSKQVEQRGQRGRASRTRGCLGRIQMPLPRRDLQLKRETPGCGFAVVGGSPPRPPASSCLASSVGRAHDS